MGVGLHGVQQVLHVLSDGGGICAALTELTPCGVEEHTALLVLKHHMELVKEHMGALASFPVEGNAVENGVGNDQQAINCTHYGLTERLKIIHVLMK